MRKKNIFLSELTHFSLCLSLPHFLILYLSFWMRWRLLKDLIEWQRRNSKCSWYVIDIYTQNAHPLAVSWYTVEDTGVRCLCEGRQGHLPLKQTRSPNAINSTVLPRQGRQDRVPFHHTLPCTLSKNLPLVARGRQIGRRNRIFVRPRYCAELKRESKREEILAAVSSKYPLSPFENGERFNGQTAEMSFQNYAGFLIPWYTPGKKLFNCIIMTYYAYFATN